MQHVVLSLVQTAIVLLIQLGASLIAMRFLFEAIGAEGFGAFQLVRQVANFGFPLLLVGLNTGLVVRIAKHHDDAQARACSLVAGVAITLASLTSLLLVVLTQPAWLGVVLFGTPNLAASWAVLGLLAATILYMLAYSVYRGEQQFLFANGLQLICMGLVPLYWAFTAQPHTSPFYLLNAISMTTAVIAFLALIPLFSKARAALYVSSKEIRAEAVALMRYGARRMVVPAVMGTHLIFGSLVLNYRDLPAAAGYYLAALAILRALDPVIGIVAIVMLPKLSQLAEQSSMTLAAYAKFCFELAAGVGLFMACQGAIHAELLVSVLLGQHQPEIVTILRIILLSLPFSIYFSLTQTLVDAWTPQGAVLRASIAALSINLAITLLLLGLVDISLGIGLPVGYAAASFVLWRYLTAQQKINTAWEQFFQAILINLVIAAISVWVLMRSEEHSALFHLILFLVSAVAYGFICRLMHMGWYCRLENAVLNLSLGLRGTQ